MWSAVDWIIPANLSCRLQKADSQPRDVRAPQSSGGRWNMLRRVSGIIAVVLAVSLLTGFAVRRFLTSQRVVDNVVAQLQSVYKGDIKLGGVDVGLESTSLTKLELFEVDSAEKTPWLSISELHTDFSLLDFFQGNSLPGKIKASGAKLLLRFAKDGTLLTALPEPLHRTSWENAAELDKFDSVPIVEFEKSDITIRTEGSPDLVFYGITGKLDRHADQLVLSGTAENKPWGKWTILGLSQKNSAKISIQFKSQAAIHVTRGMLERLPFVPEECWDEIQVSRMNTPALVHVDYDLRQGESHVRAELDPVNAHFHLASLRAQVADARAKVVFEDNQVFIRELTGRAFAGVIRAGADLMFGSDSVRVASRIEASGLDVSQLPSSWGLSPQLHGKMNGTASLQTVIAPGEQSAPAIAGMVALLGEPMSTNQLSAAFLAVPPERTIRTEGSGKGQILDATAGQVRAGTINFHLHAVPGGFRFTTP